MTSVVTEPAVAAPERVQVTGAAGVSLTASFLPGENGAAVILSHGYRGSKDELEPVATALNAAGFGVLTYDLRGCGESGGAPTFGAYEQLDLCAIVDYLETRPELDGGRIGAFGFSMGAATTLLAAALDPRLRAVVADSAWADVRHWLRPRISFRHPTAPFSPHMLKLAEVRHGFDLDDLRPMEVIGRIEPRPVLLIQGTDDEIVPPSDATLIHGAAGPSTKLWVLQGSRHGDTIAPGGEASSARTIEFFEEALLR